MTSFAAGKLTETMLSPLHGLVTFTAMFHTGNPGPAGSEHVAGENTKKSFQFAAPAPLARVVGNSAALEWTEVKFKETYTFVSLRSTVSEEFYGYGELLVPVAVEVGDTVRFNINTLQIEIP